MSLDLFTVRVLVPHGAWLEPAEDFHPVTYFVWLSYSPSSVNLSNAQVLTLCHCSLWPWTEKVGVTLLSASLQPMCCESINRSVISDSLPDSSVLGIFPGKSIGVGSHFLLQGIFLTQGLNLGLLPCRQILYHLSHTSSRCCRPSESSVVPALGAW